MISPHFKVELPQVVVAQLGARMHYAVPTLLHQHGLLKHFFTDAYVGPGSWLHPLSKIIPSSILYGKLGRLSQRKTNIPANCVTAYNLLGIEYANALTSASSKKEILAEIHSHYAQKFLERVLLSRNYHDSTAIYGFSRACLELVKDAKRRKKICYVEQPGAPIQERGPIQKSVLEEWPGWQQKHLPYIDDEVSADREHEEWELADRIIAPSEYVKNALEAAGVGIDKIITIPYAVDIKRYPQRVRKFDGSRPLRIAFVGEVNLLKGTPYLLEALQKLGPQKVRAKLIGYIALSNDKIAPYTEVVEFTGKVTRAEVAKYYNWADVFILPSLCEGSATVTYEARACGLPLIVTANSGAWLCNETDSFIIKAASTRAIVEALEKILDEPTVIEKLSLAALKNAPTLSWEAYENRLAELVYSTH